MHPKHTRRGVRRVSADRHCSRPARYPTPTDRLTGVSAKLIRTPLIGNFPSHNVRYITYHGEASNKRSRGNAISGSSSKWTTKPRRGSPMNETLTRSFPLRCSRVFFVGFGRLGPFPRRRDDSEGFDRKPDAYQVYRAHGERIAATWSEETESCARIGRTPHSILIPGS
jgi:hypothetical protein